MNDQKGSIEEKVVGYVLYGLGIRAPAHIAPSGRIKWASPNSGYEPTVFPNMDAVVMGVFKAGCEEEGLIGPITIKKVIERTVTETRREYVEA
jgi:hypothetical protein